MARLEKIFLATIIIGFMGLISSIKPSLSHSGHNNSPNIEKTQKLSEEQNSINQEIEKIEKKSSQSNEMPEEIQMQNKTSNPNNTQVSPHSEELVKSPSVISSKKFNLIPQPTELVFFLLLASPYLLYTIKNKMYKKETN